MEERIKMNSIVNLQIYLKSVRIVQSKFKIASVIPAAADYDLQF